MKTDILRAIPTEYSGVQFKSRFEAQAAVLFDKLQWPWQYEPRSFMLPDCGISYRPDFYLPKAKAFWECRGYSSEKGEAQITGFAKMIGDGQVSDEGGFHISSFVVIYGWGITLVLQGDRIGRSMALVECEGCGWGIAPLGAAEYAGGKVVEISCPTCLCPTDRNTDSRSILRVAMIGGVDGQLLINQSPVGLFGKDA